ncbi:MAG TPA: bifunctional riboflavin kinase/FAD synthetase [Anaerolineales bacterium]|nr:bifunctional riboflavin kinase/FAD synthetase [Anaerolineales bacterium]
MSHVRDLSDLTLPESALTIGSFDGLHLGHQALIRAMLAQAAEMDLPGVVLTFYPHPSVVLRGRKPAFYITPPEEKAARLLGMGVDHVITQTFDEALSRVTAAEFLDRLIRQLGMRSLWVGEDFALGHEREGNRAFLRRAAAERGFELHVFPPVLVEGEVVSSTRVREALRAGDVARVAVYLGRPFALTGRVVPGARRGQQLGFPTANLNVPDDQAYPGRGVYACYALVGDERLQAVTNVGLRPTFDDALPAPIVETHLLDVQLDLYHREIRLEFIERLREEQRFAGVEALKAQIAKDVERARQILAARKEVRA